MSVWGGCRGARRKAQEREKAWRTVARSQQPAEGKCGLVMSTLGMLFETKGGEKKGRKADLDAWGGSMLRAP